MRWLITVQLILLALAMQFAWVYHMAIWDARPDLLLILVVQFGFTLAASEAFVASWCTGLLLDLRGGGPVGHWALLFGLVSLIVSRAKGGERTTPLILRLATLLLASVLVHVGTIVIKALRSQTLGWLHVKLLVLDSLYTTVVGVLLLPIFAYLLRKLHPQALRD